MALKAILLPDNKTSIAIAHIARIASLPTGVGFFNIREKMIGWIETLDEEVSERIVIEMNDIVNNPNRAKQPDWATLMAPRKVG